MPVISGSVPIKMERGEMPSRRADNRMLMRASEYHVRAAGSMGTLMAFPARKLAAGEARVRSPRPMARQHLFQDYLHAAVEDHGDIAQVKAGGQEADRAAADPEGLFLAQGEPRGDFRN